MTRRLVALSVLAVGLLLLAGGLVLTSYGVRRVADQPLVGLPALFAGVLVLGGVAWTTGLFAVRRRRRGPQVWDETHAALVARRTARRR